MATTTAAVLVRCDELVEVREMGCCGRVPGRLDGYHATQLLYVGWCADIAFRPLDARRARVELLPVAWRRWVDESLEF